jgi:GH35 family endo-1,4-beta-xylanase
MFAKRMVPVILAVLFSLTACSPTVPAAPAASSQPEPNPAIPTQGLQTIPTEAPTMLTPTPAPTDAPKYWNTFEDGTDPAASGMIPAQSYGNVKITTENVDYIGGKQALEVSGMLPGGKDSPLSVEFSLQKLTGKDTLDFSNKMLGFSAFIPKDSPLGYPSITLSKGDKYATIEIPLPVSTNPYLDFEHLSPSQGVWVDYLANTTFSYQNPGFKILTNGSEADVKDVISHCEKFSIGSARSADGSATEAKFYLDDLNWITSDLSALPVDASIDSLRKYAANQHFQFGLLADNEHIFGADISNYVWQGDPWYAYTAVQEGAVNIMTHYFHPAENEDYSKFDYNRPEDAKIVRQYQFGQPYHMFTMGYGIGAMYGKGTPDQTWLTPQWIQNLAYPDATKALLLYHIEKDVAYTKGNNAIWLLFNEQVYSPLDGLGGSGLRNSQLAGSSYGPWAANKDDSSLIKAAFIKAREVDPGATLMLDDGNNEDIDHVNAGWDFSDYYFNFASSLKDEGVPIDGVGFELHNWIDPNGKMIVFRKRLPWSIANTQRIDMDTWLKNVDANVKRYAGKGLKVAFTEVEGQIKVDDIDFNTPAGRAEYDRRLQWQASYFAGLLKIALENDNVIMFHMWGITDRFHGNQMWGPGYDNGFIFDKHYQPKPAYYAMVDLLKSH